MDVKGSVSLNVEPFESVRARIDATSARSSLPSDILAAKSSGGGMGKYNFVRGGVTPATRRERGQEGDGGNRGKVGGGGCSMY